MPGFDSAKGRLIRSIIFPRPTQFTFYRDSLRFVAVMGGIGTSTAAMDLKELDGSDPIGTWGAGGAVAPCV